MIRKLEPEPQPRGQRHCRSSWRLPGCVGIGEHGALSPWGCGSQPWPVCRPPLPDPSGSWSPVPVPGQLWGGFGEGRWQGQSPLTVQGQAHAGFFRAAWE